MGFKTVMEFNSKKRFFGVVAIFCYIFGLCEVRKNSGFEN